MLQTFSECKRYKELKQIMYDIKIKNFINDLLKDED